MNEENKVLADKLIETNSYVKKVGDEAKELKHKNGQLDSENKSLVNRNAKLLRKIEHLDSEISRMNTANY